MLSVNTNISALLVLNQLRRIDNGIRVSLERLSSGLRVNRGADDPAGFSIAKGMEARIGGIRTATQNTEDGISLLRVVDGALDETFDVLMRMRDLAVRASNNAIWTTAQMVVMNSEFQTLKTEIDRRAGATTFNGKVLFSGVEFVNSASGGILQVGPDNGAANQITIRFADDDITTSGILSLTHPQASNLLNANGTSTDIIDPAYAQNAISLLDGAIAKASAIKASVGIQERRLHWIIDDLKTQETNLSAAKSKIMDADMAEEITEFTRLMILRQVTIALLAQVNGMQSNILTLLRI